MRHLDGTQKLAFAICLVTSALVIVAGVVWGIRLVNLNRSQAAAQTPSLVTAGFPMSGDLAPDFTLTDQFGQTQTLSSFRGQEVALAFIDSRCKTLCPLTATIMYTARQELGTTAASKIALIAVNANPEATSVNDVETWSLDHGMLHQWLFLTGSSQQLQYIYQSYHFYDAVNPDGTVVHDPLLVIIDAQGHERLSYETLDSDASSDLKDEEVGLEDGMQQWLP